MRYPESGSRGANDIDEGRESPDSLNLGCISITRDAG